MTIYKEARTIELNKIYNEDCLEGMKRIPDKSVDMILCDLPYGTTEAKWDTVIPLDDLWKEYERVIKHDGAIVLTASQPFTSILGASNPRWLKYSWVWKKSRAANGMIARHQPLKYHEDILVFGRGATTYNPQGIKRLNRISRQGGTSSDLKSNQKRDVEYVQKFTNYPSTILEFKNVGKTIHPTQKPVPLFEYLIKTYSNEGETVLDNCMGSGTTAIACMDTNRNYIGFELDKTYYNKSLERIKNHATQTELFDYI